MTWTWDKSAERSPSIVQCAEVETVCIKCKKNRKLLWKEERRMMQRQ